MSAPNASVYSADRSSAAAHASTGAASQSYDMYVRSSGQPGSGFLGGVAGAVVGRPTAAPPPPSVPYAAELVPVRAYLRDVDLPPPGIGAYGVVSLRALPTPDERVRLIMLCNAYKAYLPPQASLPSSVAVVDEMLTVWPVDDPGAPGARSDSCDYVVDHYDLLAGDQAIQDAGRQSRPLTGRGPYLIGWSPSSTRGVPHKLVLVVDMSRYTSQDSFNFALQFWKTEVVENPALWRKGFHRTALRYALRDFLDDYGEDLLSVVKLAK